VQVTSANGGIGNTWITALLVAPPQLNLFLFDIGNGYAGYGQIAAYYIELYNTAAGTTSTMAVTLSAGLDAANATLTCVSGAPSCNANASHVLSDTASVPQNTAALWLLLVPVLQDASGNTVQVTVSATGATPATVDTIDTLVIFRDGFEGNPLGTGAVLEPENVAGETFTPPIADGNVVADVYKLRNGSARAQGIALPGPILDHRRASEGAQGYASAWVRTSAPASGRVEAGNGQRIVVLEAVVKPQAMPMPQ
jgi:hypothetical protein